MVKTQIYFTKADLERAWDYFRRRDLHKLSAVDATSFVLMKRARLRQVFAFDHHFAGAGFRMISQQAGADLDG